MRVAFDHQIFTMQPNGGISRYCTTLAQHFLREGCGVRVFAGLHRNNHVRELPTKVLRGVYVSAYPPKTMPLFESLNNCLTDPSIAAWCPDILQETYYSKSSTTVPGAARVVTVHDMIHELFSKEFSNADRTPERKRTAVARCDHVICISESTKRDLVKILGVTDSKISVVHHGVDKHYWSKFRSNSRLVGEPYILYVGARGGYKNFDNFLAACASSKVIKDKVRIIAFGGGRFSRREIERISELGFGCESVLQMSGNDAVLGSLYANALCFVYPSLYEGFGLPLLEAMVLDCPVVASSTSAIPEVVRDAGLMFDPNDVNDIQRTIEEVITSNKLRQHLIVQGRENVGDFSWQKSGEKTLRVYKRLIA